MFRLYVSISGNPGTCDKIGRFQCNNGKCIRKYEICDSRDDCGDNSDESRTTGAFCGGCARFFFSFPKNIFCRPTREISFKINCLLITYDIPLDMMYVKLYHMVYLEKWNKTGMSFHKNQSK